MLRPSMGGLLGCHIRTNCTRVGLHAEADRQRILTPTDLH
jgi:hypothetical protein